jgi:hypothetical protein
VKRGRKPDVEGANQQQPRTLLLPSRWGVCLFYVGSKVAYERIAGNATEALAALKLAQKRSNAVAMAGDAGVQVVEETGRRTLRDECKRFIQAAKDRGSKEAAEVYALALEEFLSGCPKIFVDELAKEDVTRFHVALKARGMAARTVHNRHMSVRAFLISLGLDPKALAGKAPRFDKTLPEIFEPGELAAFFESLDTDYDRLFFTLILKTGLREREAMRRAVFLSKRHVALVGDANQQGVPTGTLAVRAWKGNLEVEAGARRESPPPSGQSEEARPTEFEPHTSLFLPF